MASIQNKAIEPASTPKIPKHRSPNYPAISLADAIALIEKFFKAANRATVAPKTAAEVIGYRSLSGLARAHLSALRKFGLVDDVGGRFRVSDLAVRILHTPEGSEGRQSALNEAALKPEIFEEIYRSHATADDNVLRSQLVLRQPPFSPGGADQFIRAFRGTMSLVKLNSDAYDEGMETTSRQTPPGQSMMSQPGAPASGGAVRVDKWTLSKDVSAELRIVGNPLTKAEADRLRQFVELTLSGLVE